METTKIRDVLLERRALYQQSIQQSKLEAEKFKRIAASITDDVKQQLMAILGDQYTDLDSLDVERMQTDAAYASQCEERLNTMIIEIHKYLEAELNV